MFCGALPGGVGVGGPCRDPMHKRAQPPQSVQTEVVFVALECLPHGVEPLTDLARARLGVDLQSSEELGYSRMRLRAPVAACDGLLDGAFEQALRIAQPSRLG